ncbi:MAG TPA: lysine--tRNA ligase, partial [Tepidisphaeraceae bacterium]|nr:lysine--tRNA ligase [Tepidisphaeraceae bacterium]
LEQERRQKLDAIREILKDSRRDAFGQRADDLIALKAAFEKYRDDHPSEGVEQVAVAGRIIFKRDIGKLMFIRLRDESGELQIGLDKKRLISKSTTGVGTGTGTGAGPEDVTRPGSEAAPEGADPTTTPAADPLWQIAQNLDLGDQIVVRGKVGKTKTGEITVWATDLEFASKSLLTPPAKWEGLTDVEQRYRQRYADLAYNPDVMRTMKLRIAIVDEMRAFLRARGFDEVETPMLQPIHGGAAARPFKTHHNALDIPLFLRIAPELYLKRLLVGGFSKVFEINRNFRNEGVSPRHNPEFTMLEAYEAYGSWVTMSELVEEMICSVAQKVIGTLVIEHKNEAGEVVKRIDLSQRPWRRASMAELVEDATGWKFNKELIQSQLNGYMALARASEIQDAKKFAKEGAVADVQADYDYFKQIWNAVISKSAAAEQLIELYEKLVEPNLINPTFVTRVPGVIIPLAKRCKDDDYFADVYELAINGQEISPGYTELNDPDVQAEHFRHQVGDREEQQQVDEDFLTALKYGMPPAGGFGLGVDRLVMMLTGAASIRDVILFPLMRPQA